MKSTCHENPLMPPTTTHINFTSLFVSFPASSPFLPHRQDRGREREVRLQSYQFLGLFVSWQPFIWFVKYSQITPIGFGTNFVVNNLILMRIFKISIRIRMFQFMIELNVWY